MTLYVVKVIVSALVVAGVTELTRRAGAFWGGLLASLPLVSLLAFAWLYGETRDVAAIANLSWNIFWLVLPSLTLFVALPVLLKRGIGFPVALIISLVVMTAAYLATAATVRRFGVHI
jgi:hypothetical protein